MSQSVEQVLRQRRNQINQNLSKGYYINNPLNRSLGRVGQRYGKDELQEIQDHRSSPDTQTLYKKSDGTYSENRVKVHDKIFSNAFDGKIPQSNPKVTLLVGGPGSGKSFVYETALKSSDNNSVYLNSDDVKEQLPEYSDYLKKDFKSAAAKVHEESSDVYHAMVKKGFEQGYNLVLDATFSNKDKSVKIINQLKDKGYSIEVVGVVVDPSKTQYSATKRAYEQKRYVPGTIVKNANYGARQTMKYLLTNKDIVDSIHIYDNNGLNKKQPFKPIVQNNKIISPKQLKKQLKV